MIFKSIKLSNFRQFRDNEVITFSTNPLNNVTLFIADNNVGKTTLLQAFLWCLYGEVKLDNSETLANIVEFNKLKVGEPIEVSVELEIISESKEYVVNRKIVVMKNNNFEQVIITKPENQLNVFVKLDNGTTINESQKVIGRLFPRDLSDYFFFDGERMKDLGASNVVGKKDLALAVKSIFNLDVLEKVEKIISEIYKKWDSKKTVASDVMNLFNKYKLDLQKAETDLANNRKELLEKENQHNKYIEIIKKNEDYLFDNKMMTVHAESRKHYETTKNNIEKRTIEIKNEIKRDFLKNLIDINLSKYLNETKLALSTYDSESKMISGINANAIREIIQRGVCICGEDLTGGDNKHVHELRSMLSYLPPENLGILLKTLIILLESKSNNKENIINNVETKIRNLYSEYQNISDIDDSIQEINREIGKITENYEDIQNAEKRLVSAKESDRTLPSEINRLNKNIETLENNVNSYKRALDKLTERYEENNKLINRISILEEVKKRYRADINKQEVMIRGLLTTRVQQYLDKILKTKYTIVINKTYGFTILDKNNSQVTGEGYKVVVSFAFIAGIIDLLNEQVISFTMPESFPLVMDAPFAKLDDHNRISINRMLPSIARQLILFTTDSQWTGAVENELKEKIGKKYEMKNHFENDVENGLTRVVEVK
jgi:DNA sulfur modification protein DndD